MVVTELRVRPNPVKISVYTPVHESSRAMSPVHDPESRPAPSRSARAGWAVWAWEERSVCSMRAHVQYFTLDISGYEEGKAKREFERCLGSGAVISVGASTTVAPVSHIQHTLFTVSSPPDTKSRVASIT